MVKKYGTSTLLDTLATYDKDNVFEYGVDRMLEHLADLAELHNDLMNDVFATFMSRTTDKIFRFGADAVEGEMTEVDEDGLADVQKVAVAGYDVGFPLRMYQYGRQWTDRFLRKSSVSDIAIQVTAAQVADAKKLKRVALDALFRPTNYTFNDRLDNYVDLPVKALINADSSAIPMDPFGATFDGSTHTHYLARAGASLAASDIVGAINTVIEHNVNGGRVSVWINTAQEAAVRAFTANFMPLYRPLLEPGPGNPNDQLTVDTRFDPYSINNRQIGVWDGFVEVWTKPWVPANYILVIIEGGNNEPVLRMRTDPDFPDWRMVSRDGVHPIYNEHFERTFGVGVWNRLACAVLYTGNTVYAAPVLTG